MRHGLVKSPFRKRLFVLSLAGLAVGLIVLLAGHFVFAQQPGTLTMRTAQTGVKIDTLFTD